MFSLLIIAIIFVAKSISKEINVENKWLKFKSEFDKTYESAGEEHLRKSGAIHFIAVNLIAYMTHSR